MPGGQREKGKLEAGSRSDACWLVPVAALILLLSFGYAPSQAEAPVQVDDPVSTKAGLIKGQRTLRSYPDSKVGWPYYRIRYKVTKPGVASYAHWAARVWNRANVRYKFVRVKKKSRAQVLIGKSGQCGIGRVTPDFQGDNRASKAWISNCGSRASDQRLAAQMLGYILGLGDRGKCGLMSYCGAQVRRPTKDERRRMRRMARARDKAVKAAPKTPKLSILRKGEEYPDDEGFGSLGAAVDFKLRLRASFAHLTWVSFRAYVKPVKALDDLNSGFGDYDPVECENSLLKNFWSFEDAYGPWGAIKSWRATDWFSCPFGGEPGTYQLIVRARSAKGLILRANRTFEVSKLISFEE